MQKLKFRKIHSGSACVLVLLSAAGCSSTPYAETPHWGQSVRHAWTGQTLNPQAGQKNQPLAGTDGAVMNSAVERYESSFEKPPAPVNVMNIGVGATAGTSGR